MTHTHGPCGHRGALTKYGQAHSCCITITGECNSWLSPLPLAPNPIFPASSQTLRLFSYAVPFYFSLHSYFRLFLCSLLSRLSPTGTHENPPCHPLLALAPQLTGDSQAIADLGPSCVSRGVKWFHGYKYDTAHKQVLGYKGLACICTTPSFSCAAWITHCTADTSILCWWA